ncbi:hypothetical protein JTB14_003460 [Gonioctena quinquepunctata]|nr:hypothetical protein JTB14_003460 [Gonioctena quinquepunctata]
MEESVTLFKRDRERSKLYYPIYKLWTLEIYCVCFISPEDIELILSNPKHNTKHMFYDFLHIWLGSGLLTSSGSKWQRRRKILTPAFHFSILQNFTDVFYSETKNLVKVLEKTCNEDYIDVVKPITEFTLYSIGETSLGVNLSQRSNCDSYKKAIFDFGHNMAWRVVRPWLYPDFIFKFTNQYKKVKSAVDTLHDFSTNIIEERKKNFDFHGSGSYSEGKKIAMLDLLLKFKYEGEDIDDEGIREEVDTFMFEGHDTTSVALCHSLMAIANEKQFQDEMYEEIIEILGESDRQPTLAELGELKFTERCIKECLRLYPSVPFVGRVCGEEFKTHSGYTIPKNALLNVYIFDLHRSPQIWEDPEKFDPDRFLPDNIAKRHPFAYLPFSAGPRNCIGQRFAMLELKTAIVGILRKFKLEPVDKPEDMVFLSDMVLRPKGKIRVKFVLRK